MNAGIDVPQIQRFGALYIASARLKSMSKWKAIIAAVDVGNPLFYLIAVGIGIGVLVEQGSGTSGTNGIKYIAFIAPALLANTAITGIMDETVFPTIEGFKWRKLFFAQNSTPITGRQIAIGVYLAALCRAIFSVSVYYILLLAFDVVNFGISVLLMPIAVLGGGAFGALMLFAAAKIEKEDQFFNILGRLVIMPMFLFSGTFFPLSSMPIFLQPIGWISPLWHATELGREAAFDYGITSTMVIVHLAFLITMLVTGLTLATRQFEKRLAK
jgi:lipooligosaccharide transport system permease protein